MLLNIIEKFPQNYSPEVCSQFLVLSSAWQIADDQRLAATRTYKNYRKAWPTTRTSNHWRLKAYPGERPLLRNLRSSSCGGGKNINQRAFTHTFNLNTFTHILLYAREREISFFLLILHLHYLIRNTISIDWQRSFRMWNLKLIKLSKSIMPSRMPSPHFDSCRSTQGLGRKVDTCHNLTVLIFEHWHELILS